MLFTNSSPQFSPKHESNKKMTPAFLHDDNQNKRSSKQKKKSLQHKLVQIFGNIASPVKKYREHENNDQIPGKFHRKEEEVENLKKHIQGQIALIQATNKVMEGIPSATVLSGFPSTQSNRKGKNPSTSFSDGGNREESQRTRRRRKNSPMQPPLHPAERSVKSSCVEVTIGRLVCKKYIPRLQMIEEVKVEAL